MATNHKTQNHPVKSGYSESYKRIKKQAESWPSWKVAAYNNYATSRAEKISTSK